MRLLYTNSGIGVLALGANGIQKLWKWWLHNEQNPTRKVIPGHFAATFLFSLFFGLYDKVF